MIVLNILVQFAGATMLLLFAVRLVQTGAERLAGGWLKRKMAEQRHQHIGAALAGTGIALLLQSATAVTLIVVGFFSNGTLGFASGLAIILGADLGSAIAVQLLSFDIDWLPSLLIGAGGWLFLKVQSFKWRHIGRILLGIGIILMALRLFGLILSPLTDHGALLEIAGYLQSDVIAAFMLGAALTLLMHSSVATILIVVSMVANGVLPLSVGLSIMLGANFGSGLIPVLLTRNLRQPVRHLVFANAFLRGTLALLTLFFCDWFGAANFLDRGAPAQGVVTMHLLFNAMLLLALPFVGSVERLSVWLQGEVVSAGGLADQNRDSHLVPGPHTEPEVALASMKREVLRMGKLLSDMTNPVILILEDPSRAEAENNAATEANLNAALAGIKAYGMELPFSNMEKSQRREARSLTEAAIDIAAAGDIVSHKLLQTAQCNHQAQIRFSIDGLRELQDIHDCVVENLHRALTVLTTGDPDIARQAIETKARVRELEQRSRKRHLKRLHNGVIESRDSSNAHLDALYALKELNAKITSLTHPALSAEGQLLDSRLVPLEPVKK